MRILEKEGLKKKVEIWCVVEQAYFKVFLGK